MALLAVAALAAGTPSLAFEPVYDGLTIYQDRFSYSDSATCRFPNSTADYARVADIPNVVRAQLPRPMAEKGEWFNNWHPSGNYIYGGSPAPQHRLVRAIAMKDRIFVAYESGGDRYTNTFLVYHLSKSAAQLVKRDTLSSKRGRGLVVIDGFCKVVATYLEGKSSSGITVD